MRVYFYHIRDLSRVGKSMYLAISKQITVALIRSKLDCNSLFHNISSNDVARLQYVQNCLARVTTKAPRFRRSVPILKPFHWFPVKFRIYFKICTITFRTIKDNQPAYLADLLVQTKYSKCLCSTNANGFCYSMYKNQNWVNSFLHI